jgi:hypothetical protein
MMIQKSTGAGTKTAPTLSAVQPSGLAKMSFSIQIPPATFQ